MTIIPPIFKTRRYNRDYFALPDYMPLEKVQTAIETFTEWGFKVMPGKTLGHQFHYFSGTDEERLTDLQHMMDDKNIKAIFCARGGMAWEELLTSWILKNLKNIQNGSLVLVILPFCKLIYFQIIKLLLCMRQWLRHLTMENIKINIFKALMML